MRSLLGDRLVTCDQWGSIIDYPLEPAHHGNKGYLDKTALHYDGASDIWAWMDRNGGRNRNGEEANIRRVDRFHKYSRGWAHGFAYGWALGPFTGRIYEARSFWIRWGAHLGDLDDDGIAANDEAAPIYANMGAPNQQILPAWEDAYNTLQEALNTIAGFDLPEYGHRDIQADTNCPGDFLWEWVHNRPAGGQFPMFVKYGDNNQGVTYWQARILRIDENLLPTWGIDGQYGDEMRAAVALLCGDDGLEIGPVQAEMLDAMVLPDHRHKNRLDHKHTDDGQRVVAITKMTGKVARVFPADDIDD